MHWTISNTVEIIGISHHDIVAVLLLLADIAIAGEVVIATNSGLVLVKLVWLLLLLLLLGVGVVLVVDLGGGQDAEDVMALRVVISIAARVATAWLILVRL